MRAAVFVFIASLVLLGSISITAAANEDGFPCSANSDCQSGYCADGYCCNTPCEGNCNKCNIAHNTGRCIPDDTLCEGTDDSCFCAGSCVSCPAGTECLNQRCVEKDKDQPQFTSSLPEPVPLSAPVITIIAILLLLAALIYYKPELLHHEQQMQISRKSGKRKGKR